MLDLKLPKMTGFALLDGLKEDPRHRDVPVIIHTGKQLTRRDETRLRRYADSIIVKDAASPERLLAETALFLHRPPSRAARREPPACSSSCTRADAVLQGKRVLIVDDDVRNVFALTSALEARGMRVRFAENGREAIESLDADPGVDLVLMDVMMPEMDGHETTRALRADARFADLPVIALTAKAMKGDREKSIAAGASDYITKPVDIEQLISLMRVWLYRVNQANERRRRRAARSLEIDLLLEAIQRRYGYDFRGYAIASLRRRLWHRVYGEGLQTLSGLQERILHEPGCMDRLLRDLSINVTEMFRDPSFYRALRERVFPLLRTHPFIRVWNAGCSTGEEIYSLAIALREEGLLERTRIYATDIDDAALARASAGAFPLERMQRYTENYLRAGGTEAFSSYYAANGDSARFDPALGAGIVVAQHNLVTDGSFNEFHLIVCRNVMIYFGSALQEEVLQLFGDSMTRFGILALGRKESIRRSRHAAEYEALDEAEKIFRRRL